MKTEKKYKGVFYDDKTKTFYVSTTFTTLDGFKVRGFRRGFKSEKQANTWKVLTAKETSENYYSKYANGDKQIEIILQEYLTHKRGSCRPTTIKNLRNYLKIHFIPFFKSLKNIKLKEIHDCYGDLANSTLTNSSKNQILSSIMSFAEYLNDMDYIINSVYKKFKIIFIKFNTDDDAKEPQSFTFEEVRLILNELENCNTIIDYKYRVIFNILAFTGCRISECLALKFSDVDNISNTISFNKEAVLSINIDDIKKNTPYEVKGSVSVFQYTKTQNKCIKVNNKLIQIIADYKARSSKGNDDYIFERKGIITSENVVLNKLKRVLLSLGLKPRKLHSFRHFHTSQLYENGFDAKYIAERLGHSNVNTSMNIYNHLSKDKLEEQDNMAINLII